MAANESGGSLLNLQIEVDNESEEEEMDTDVLSESKESETTVEEEDDEAEEGELSDSKNSVAPQLGSSVGEDRKRRENKEGGFIAGVDICSKEVQNKLGERAKRFGLDTSTIKPLTEQELKKLYDSLGMTTEEAAEKTFRLHALHMRGTEDMSTKDVFTYFKAFGPASVEWINDYTCNVVWLEDLSAAKALIALSRQIKGLEKLHTRSKSPPKEEEETKDGKEEVVIEEESDSEGDTEMVEESNPKQDSEKLAGAKPVTPASVDDGIDDAVDALSITIPIPPGKWRAGITHPKAKNILLRFATRADKKHPKAEKLSEYYKKYGNPNYGGIPGILTESRKRRFRRNEHMPNKYDKDFNTNENELDITKNPWGTLAESWSSSGNQECYERYSPPRKITRPVGVQSQVTVSHGLRSGHVQTRIGVFPGPASGSDNDLTTSDDDDEEMSTRTKVPRMRMYADEEEVKIEKRKAQRKKRTYVDEEQRGNHRSDLRHRLGRESQGHGEHNRSRERDRDHEHSRDREHNRERVQPKVSSTVWSRLHHGQSKSSSLDSEAHTVERKRKNRPTPEKQILSDDSDELFEKPLQLAFGDLRSKLNSMKTVGVKQKSPLRIEIDNDEYYRVIGSESDE